MCAEVSIALCRGCTMHSSEVSIVQYMKLWANMSDLGLYPWLHLPKEAPS